MKSFHGDVKEFNELLKNIHSDGKQVVSKSGDIAKKLR
jgi:hypothetical protein